MKLQKTKMEFKVDLAAAKNLFPRVMNLAGLDLNMKDVTTIR